MYVGCVTGGGYIDGDGIWRVFHLLVRCVWPGVGPVIRVQHPPHTHPDPLHDGKAFITFRPIVRFTKFVASIFRDFFKTTGQNVTKHTSFERSFNLAPDDVVPAEFIITGVFGRNDFSPC